MRICLLSFFIYLFCLTSTVFAQPVWQPGTPALRKENRTLSIITDLDRKSVIHYVVYRLANDPGAGAITAANLKTQTSPGTRHDFGSFNFGDASYCRNSYPGGSLAECGAVDGNLNPRGFTFTAATATTYVLYVVAEDFVVTNSFSTVERRTILQTTSNASCFRVGSGTLGPQGIFSPNLINNCSPATFNLSVGYIGVDFPDGTDVTANINFGDLSATGTDQVLPLQLSPLGTPEMNKALRLYRQTFVNVYDYSSGDNPAINPDGSGCTFQIDVEFNAGATDCGSVVSGVDFTTNATVWDVPNTIRGLQDVEPNGLNNDDGGADDEEYEICGGSRENILFIDNSVFNCTTVEDARNPLPNAPNREARWVQWVYGAAGTTVTTSGALNDQITINGQSFTAAQLPIYGPVTYIPASIAANPNTPALPIQMPINAAPGAVLMVEMRSWNTCLPYDSDVSDANGLNPSFGTFDLDGGLNNNNNWLTAAGAWPGNATTFPDANRTPVTFQKPIVIVDAPDPPSFSPNPYVVCEELPNNSYLITVSSPVPTPTYRFYSDAALLNLQRTDAAAPYNYNPATQGSAAFNKDNPGTYIRYATVQADVGNGQTCTSLPVEIPIVIEEKVTPGVIAHAGPLTICNGENPVAFTSTTPASGGRDGTPTYQWYSSPTPGGPYAIIPLATSVTYDPPALTTTTYFIRRATSDNGGVGGVCAFANSNEIGFVVQNPVTGGTISGDQTVCNGVTNPPVINSTAAPTNGAGAPYTFQWEISTTSDIAGFVNIPGANAATYDPPTPLAQTTWYRRRVNSGVSTGVCSGFAYATPVVQYTVDNAVVPGVIDNAQVICSGDDPLALTSTSSASGGDGATYTYQWQRSTTSAVAGFADIGSATAETFDPAVLTQTTWYRRVAFSGVCAQAESNVIEITVNALPTASVSGGGSACSGNPASDVVFTFTGTGPFDLVYAIDGVSQPIENNVTSPFAISAPADGLYTIVSVTDSNTPNCSVTSPSANLTGSATVTTQVIAPPSIESFTVSAAVCDDGGTTDPPDATLNLLPDAVANYNITYRIRRISNNALSGLFSLNNVASNALGEIVISPSYANLGGAPDVQGYRIELASIVNVATLCSGNPGNSDVLIVNPRPATPISDGDIIVCSDVVSTASVSVDDPGAGFTIDWYDDPTAGVQLLAGNNVLDPAGVDEPTPGNTVIYYAETRNTATGCVSSSRIAVTLTSDELPATAPAGLDQPNLCSGNSITLAAGAVGSSGTGTWIVPGALAYQQNFTAPNTTAVAGGLNGYSRDISDPETFTGGTGYFHVNGNQFEANNTNGTLGAGAGNRAELVWNSSPIDISTFGAVNLSMNLINVSNNLAGPDDFLIAEYRINQVGGYTILTNGNQVGNFANVTATANGLTGNILEVRVRVALDGATNTVAFDNVLVRTAASSITFTNPNNPATTVSGLPQNVPGGAPITTTLRWVTSSEFGVCSPTFEEVDLTVHALPTAFDPAPELCEDTFGSRTVVGVDLTTYDNAVTGLATSVVEWFEDAGLTDPAEPVEDINTNATYTTTEKFYFRVTSAAPQSCINTGEITFTVKPLPAVANPTLVSRTFCEDNLGDNQATGINLVTLYNAQINATATITWFTSLADAQGNINQIPAGAIAMQTGNYIVTDGLSLFARVVDGNSCVNYQEVEFVVNGLPVANDIRGPGGVTGTITVCRSGEILLFQLDPDINDRGGVNPTYDWTIPTGAGEFQLFGGGGPGDFFVLLQFPNSIPSPGLQLRVRETTATNPGCPGAENIITIIVEDSPLPPVIVGPAEVCVDQQNVQYNVTSATVGSTYTWTVPGAMGSIVSGQGGSAGVITVNIGPDADAGTFLTAYQIEVSEFSAAGCSNATPATRNVRVHDKPTVSVASPLTICSGSAPNESVVMNVPGSTFTWEVLTISSNVTGTNQGDIGNGDIIHALTNTSNAEGLVTYRITAFGPDIDPIAPGVQACQGQQTTLSVRIEPVPQAVAVNNAATICSGGMPNFSVTSPTLPTIPANLRFDVTPTIPLGINATGVALTGFTNVAAPFSLNAGTLTNTTNAAITVSYSITPKLTGCTDGPPQVVNVVVEPSPTAVVVNNATLICNGDNADIEISSLTNPSIPANLTFDIAVSSTNDPATGGTAYSDVLGQSFPFDITGTLTNSSDEVITVTFTITPKLNGCADGAPVVRTVQIEPSPRAIVTNNAPLVCNGGNANISITNPVTPTVPGNLLADITVVSSNPGATGGTAFTTLPLSNQAYPININGTLANSSNAVITLTYTITPKLNGCANGTPIDVIVEIEPTPSAAINNTDLVICNGGNTAIEITTPTTSSTPSELEFDLVVSSSNPGATGGTAFSNVSNQSYPFNITGTLTNSSNSAITVTFTVTPELNGTSTCANGGTIDTQVVVEPTPVAQVINNLTSSICNGSNVDVDITSPTSPSVAGDLTFDIAVSSDDDPATGGTAYADVTGQSFPFDITGTLTNSSDDVITVTFTITPKLNGCIDGTPIDVEVEVEPSPRAVVTNNAPLVCNGGNANINITNPVTPTTPGNLSADITVISSNPGATGGTAFTTLPLASQPYPINITGTLTNSSNAVITLTYTITPKLLGCANGTPIDVIVEIEPTPSAAINNTDLVICNGGNTAIEITTPTTSSTPSELEFDLVVTSSNLGATGGTAFSNVSNQSYPFNIIGTLTNSSSSVITVTFTVTPKLNSVSGCANGSNAVTTVQVEPTPLAAVVNNDVLICNGGNVDLDISSPSTPTIAGDLTFDVAVNSTNDPATGGTAYADLLAQTFTPGYTIDGTLTNSSDAVITVTFTITPKLNGCADGTPVVRTVQVEPTPRLVRVNNAPVICNNGNTNITITSPTLPTNAGSDLRFNIVATSTNPGATSGTAFVSPSNVSFPFTINGTLINSSNSVITVTYQLTPLLNGCPSGAPVFETVEVEPTPVASINNTTTRVCNGDAVNLAISSPTTPTIPGDLRFDVAVSSTNAAVTGGAAFNNLTNQSFPLPIIGNLTNSSNAPVTVTFTITPRLSGCNNGAIVTTTVVVEPTPRVAFVNNLPKVCNNGTPNITVTSPTSSSVAADQTFDVSVSFSDPGLSGTGVAGNGIVGQAAPFSINTGVLTNTTASFQTATYTITPKINGCADGPVEIVNVIVEPTPTAAPTNNLAVICNNGTPDIDVISLTVPSVPANLTFDITVVLPAGLSGTGNAANNQNGLSAPFSINSGTLTNSTNTPKTVQYTITPRLSGCAAGPVQVVTVIVEPSPQAVLTNATPTICSEDAVSIGVATPTIPNTGALTFDVVASLPAGVTGTGVAANGVIGATFPFTITGTLEHDNLSNAPLTVTYTITPKLSGCADGPPQVTTVIVRPLPVGVADARPVCSDDAFSYNIQTENLDNLGNVVNSRFTFEVFSSDEAAVPTPLALDRTIASSAAITGNFVNTSGADVIVTYRITPFSITGNCEGIPFDVEFTIRSKPTAPPITTEPICSGDALNFDLQTIVDNVGGGGNALPSKFRYTVVSSNPGVVFPAASRVIASTASITDSYTNLSNSDVTITYTVTPLNQIGDCVGSNFEFRVIVRPEPVGISIIDPTCSGPLNHNIQANHINVAGGNSLNSIFTYTVSSSDVGAVAPGADRVAASNLPITDTYTNTSGADVTITYTITPFNAANPGCAGTPFTYSITISSRPIAATTTDAPICSDTPIVLNPQNYVTNGVIITKFDWKPTYVNMTGTLPISGTDVFNATGNITGSLTNITNVQQSVSFDIIPYSGNCNGPLFTVTLPIDPRPVIDPSVTPRTICSDLPTNIVLSPVFGTTTHDNYNITLTSVDPDLVANPGNAALGNNLPANTIELDSYTNDHRTNGLFVVYNVVANRETTPGLVCLGNQLLVTVEILPEPVMDPALATAVVCSDADSNIELATDGISVPATSFYLNSTLLNGTNIGGNSITVGDVTSGTGNAVPNADPVTGARNRNVIRTDNFNLKVDVAAMIDKTIVYNITPRAGICFGDPFDIALEIRPEPVIDPVFPSPVCSDDMFGIILNAETTPPSVAIADFTIAGVSFDLGLTKGSSNTNIGDVEAFPFTLNDQYTNPTEGVLQARYIIVPRSADNCFGDPDNSVVVDISPVPTVADGLNNIVCSDADAEIVIRDTESATGVGFEAESFEITRGAIGALIPVGALADLSNPFDGQDNITAIENDRYINPTNSPINVIYSVTAWTGAGATLCESPIKDIVLTVEPTIVAAPLNGNPVLCSGTLTEVVMDSPSSPTAGDITFNVSIPAAPAGVTGFSSGTSLAIGFPIEQTLVNNGNIPQVVQYQVTPRAASAGGGTPGCLGAPVLVDVLVEPKPKLASSVNVITCEDDALAVALSTTTTPTVAAGYGTVEYELLTVDDPSTTLAGNSPAGSIYATASSIIDVLTTTSLNPVVATYTLRPRFEVPASVVASGALADYCVGDEREILVTVNPRARISPPTDLEVCSGEEFNQLINVIEADPASTLITWTRIQNPITGITGSSNGAGDVITQVLFNSTNDVGTITYTFTPKSFNCTGPVSTLVATVLPGPKIVGLGSSFNICNDADFEVDLDAFSPTTNALFDWTIANPDPLVTGSTGGTGLSIDDTWNNLTDALATVTYTIVPKVLKTNTDECFGPEKIVSLNIAPPVNATLFSSTGDNDAFLCETGRDFVFFENTGLPSFDMVYREDDGTTVNDISLTKQGSIKLLQVQPLVTTTYTILSVKDAFGCEFIPTTDNVVTVNVGNTDATFNILGDAINCSPFPVDFEYNQQNGVVYNWKWFDGEPDSTYTATAAVTGQVVTHTFFNPAPTATVKYKVFLETSFPDAADPDDNYPGGCFKTSFKEVQVYPTVATAVFPDKTEICSGEEVRFVNTSQGVRSDKFFYRVQGSTGELEPRTGTYTPPQRPATSTLYTLENLTVANPLVLEVVYQAANLNCPAADVVIPITVYRGATADFTTTAPTLFVGGHSFVNITNTTNPIDALDFNYEWTFGADANPADFVGTTPTNPIDYVTPGLKEITLLVSNRLAATNGLVCSDFISKTIDIEVPPLSADFVATPLAACFPTDITVIENLATGDVFAWTVIDDRGRVSATSNANLPIFAIPNPGKYTIILSTSNSFTGDEVTELKELEIFESPLASFELRPTVVFIPDQEVTIFNFSTGANQYDWDFGDGNTSIDFEPKITYRVEGDYPVTLVAGFNHGDRDVDGDGVLDGAIICYDTLTRTVQAKDGGLTRIPNAFTPSPNGPNGGNAGAGSFNDVFLPITKGVEEFMMQVFDRWGNLVFESRDKNQGWDGYNRNGILMPAGVYVYKLELRLSNGERTTQVGDITLIR